MKHLIVYSHPNANSLNHHLLNTLVMYLKDGDHEVIVRDLYELAFNPVLSLADLAGQRKGLVTEDVKQEQDHITWADCITFIHPIWWTGLPAIMKGYIDRVFTYGFAYRYDNGIQKGLLTGKQTVIINTHGKSNAEYKAIGMNQALLLTSDQGIYAYSGLEILQHLLLGKADRAVPEEIDQWTEQIKSIFKN